MKVKAILASFAACAIAASAMAISASAALCTRVGNGEDATKEYIIPVDGLDLSQLDKVVVDITADTGVCNGIIGYNDKNGTWTEVKQETNGKTADVWTADGLGGIQDSLKIQLYWINPYYDEAGNEIPDKPGTLTIESVKLYDANGAELQKVTTTTTTSGSTTTTTTAAGNKGNTEPAAKTGDAGTSVAVTALGLAAVAAYIARKKH